MCKANQGNLRFTCTLGFLAFRSLEVVVMEASSPHPCLCTLKEPLSFSLTSPRHSTFALPFISPSANLGLRSGVYRLQVPT